MIKFADINIPAFLRGRYIHFNYTSSEYSNDKEMEKYYKRISLAIKQRKY